MKARVQLVEVLSRSGNKNGKDWAMIIARCVVEYQDDKGETHFDVGELVLPKNHPVVSVGMYDADFGIAVSRDKQVTGRLLSLTPVKAPAIVSTSSSIPKL